ncbi:hypothetical protein [Lichenicoccus sp.]|uniref:hypothetical protein n=1 Tax=Lichenicoccus sp. TaxID=2781899 RepID=UPI003D115691
MPETVPGQDAAAPAGRELQDAFLHADQAERRWNLLVLGVVGFIILFVSATSFRFALSPPSNVETIVPASLHVRGEFVEENLGTVLNSDGSATVRFVAEQFAFVPSCLMVPAGRTVTFRTTTPDVIHGMLIQGSNANTMIVPGYVSQIATRFDTPGTYAMPCHEFCGVGHHAMWGSVHVVRLSDWPRAGHAPVACAPH